MNMAFQSRFDSVVLRLIVLYYLYVRGVALTFFIGMVICKKLSVLVWPNALLAIPNFFLVWPNIKVQND